MLSAAKLTRLLVRKARISPTLVVCVHPPPALKKIGEGFFLRVGGGCSEATTLVDHGSINLIRPVNSESSQVRK